LKDNANRRLIQKEEEEKKAEIKAAFDRQSKQE
jgi:hypothetical protein